MEEQSLFNLKAGPQKKIVNFTFDVIPKAIQSMKMRIAGKADSKKQFIQTYQPKENIDYK